MIVSRCLLISSRVGYLSKMASYMREAVIIGYFIPWIDSPSDLAECEFVLENGDNFVLENDDRLIVRTIV